MKSTGVTRKIDELGRVVIPKEIRKNLGIRDGESLEISISEDKIILNKYSELKKLDNISQKLCDLINKNFNINLIITDREKIIASADNKLLINKRLDQKLIYLIDNRETYESNSFENIVIEGVELSGFFLIIPIIVESDSLGLIILYSVNNNNFINIANFIKNIIVEKIDIN